MTRVLAKPALTLAAAALAAALLIACAEGPGGPAPRKRQSYFEVLSSVPAPGRGLADLTYTHGYIWLADENLAGTIYKIKPSDGSVVSSAGTSHGPPTAICSDGAYLYVADGDTGDVWRHELSSRMEALDHFPTGLADVRGMYYDAGRFYVWDQATFAVYEFDASWQPGGSWPVGQDEEWIRGMTNADGRVWSADWRNGWLNRHKQGDFGIQREYCTPGQHPSGLGWDGSYLYLGDAGARRIYKLDISTAP